MMPTAMRHNDDRLTMADQVTCGMYHGIQYSTSTGRATTLPADAAQSASSPHRQKADKPGDFPWHM